MSMPDSCVDLNANTRRRPARASPDGENPTHARMPAGRAALALVLLAIATTAATAPADDVRLRIEGDAGSYLAWADNTLSGPVEVMLHSDSTGVRGEPELPARATDPQPDVRSEEHTSELQSLMRISYAVFCLKKKKET